jgi:hypothetical protein
MKEEMNEEMKEEMKEEKKEYTKGSLKQPGECGVRISPLNKSSSLQAFRKNN